MSMSDYGPMGDVILGAAASLFDDADFDDPRRITVDERDVHPEYLRGVQELAGRLLGLDDDQSHRLILARQP